MIIYPAIDIKNGKCVRLKEGVLDDVTIYNDDPIDQALIFQNLGAEWIHIVDLDAAETGKPVNAELIRKIVAATNTKIQIGGGIRDAKTAGEWLDLGVNRIILGTIAVKNTDEAIKICNNHAGKVAVGLDAKGDNIAINGWVDVTEHNLFDFAAKFADNGAAAIIYTDISRDGLLKGLNFNNTRKLAEHVKIDVIASGGLASIDDIKELLKPENSAITGAITGRAIYDGRLDLKEALELANKSAG